MLRNFGTFNQDQINDPRPFSRSTINIHFGTLTFVGLNFPCFLPPGILLPRVHDLSTHVLPQINGCESLWLFELREFQTLRLHFLLEFFHPKSMMHQCVSHRSMVVNRFSSSGFRSFKLYAFTISRSVDPLNRCEIYFRVSSRINGRYVLWPSGLWEFLTQ
jgi:hypothetical protein